MRAIKKILTGIALVSLSRSSTIASIEHETEKNLAPLIKARGNDRLPDEYLIELHDDVTPQQHFETIGGDLKKDNSTVFKWFKIAHFYHATNLTNDWVYQVRRDPGARSVVEVEYLANMVEAWVVGEAVEPPSPGRRLTVWFSDKGTEAP